MLQQTGVDRVQPSYERFLQRFPSFEALAQAPRVEVLRAWAGLGYNRRALNLQACAQAIVHEHGGTLPADPDALQKLPGIGPYTAAALRSLVFHHDVAALDTNVRRVIGRLRFSGAPTERELRAEANRLVPPGRSADWNQALMDFGSAQCTATRPACLVCPVADLCVAVQGSQVPDAVPRTEWKVAERPEPYPGSRRYYRGRLVAFLRDLPAGALVPLSLAQDAAWADAAPTAGEAPLLLARTLAQEGLARLDETSGEPLIGPPL
jgi:A/G-specific adenine glycosylase